MIALRKKLLWVVLLVLVLNFTTALHVNPCIAQPNKVYVDPPFIDNSSLGIGSEFTVNVSILGAENIYSYQVYMVFNPEVVNVTSVEDGGFLFDWGGTWLPPIVNNTAGFVQAVCTIYPPWEENAGAWGDGTLAIITFKVKALDRGTLLQVGNKRTLLYTVAPPFPPGTADEILDFPVEDSSFDNRPDGLNLAPEASFYANPLVPKNRGEVVLNASGSSDPDAWLMSYHWDYGDGTAEVFMREGYGRGNATYWTSHFYHKNGTYTVTLTVKDNDNVTDVTSGEVTVLFDLAVTNVESPYMVVMPGVLVTVNVTVANNGDFLETFNATAYCNEIQIERREVSNLLPKAQKTLTFDWNTAGLDPGEYILKANVTIQSEEIDVGNNEYIDGSVTIASSNVVDFPLVVGGVTFHVLTDSVSIISELKFSPQERKLSFEATGQEGTDAYCNVTIPVELLGGTYTVLHNDSAVAPDPQEATNGTHTFLYFTYTHSTLDIFEIIGETAATPPIPIITPSETKPLVNELVTLDSSSSYDPDGTISSRSWNLGDGNVAGNVTEVQHSYSPFGNYTVTLTVSDGKYSNSTTIIIRAIDYPIAKFTYSPTAPFADQAITFNATTSLPRGGSITDYSWNFGDGQTGTGRNLTHAYFLTGIFSVNLTTTDSEGLSNCTAQAITVTIHNVAITSMTASSNAVEKGEAITLQITAANIGNYTENFTVTAYFNTTTIKTESVSALNPGSEKLITVTWSTASATPGTYTLKAEASTVEEETRTSDNILLYGSVTVAKITSSISITSSSGTVTLGRNTIIYGTLDPARSGTSIAIQYRLSGGEWVALATVISDAHAQYLLNWRPQESGVYEVQAIWQGDADTKSCQSETLTVTVQEGGGLSSERILTYLGIIVAIIALILLTLYLMRLRKK